MALGLGFSPQTLEGDLDSNPLTMNTNSVRVTLSFRILSTCEFWTGTWPRRMTLKERRLTDSWLLVGKLVSGRTSTRQPL